ncbi:hypothetical protein [Pseudomonas syringae]|uniref:hypothetical protein n=1 Tax=Pseudomonas syringae TaxID=317 RepID=UPI000EFE9EC5|nr:hypothetical protein [Pseudomonas syringae]
MIQGKGNAKFCITGQDEDIEFEDVEFTYTEGETVSYVGADNTGGAVNGSGTLSFKLAPFKLWAGTYMVYLVFYDGHHNYHTFEIIKMRRQPFEEGGWLRYPVMVIRARLYSEE